MPHLAPLWEPHAHRRLVEPFAGGMAVTLGLAPVQALLNDVNPHLVNFFRWLQRGLCFQSPMENNEDAYYRARETFNGLLRSGREDSREAAELFYYLNRTGYNGLCRFNRRGEFNVPFGRYARINYGLDCAAYREVLAPWQFECGDFEALELDRADFVYADPPYDVEFTSYSKDGFNWDDQVRLADWLCRHPGPVVLSNQATARVVDLYSALGFQLQFLDAPRMISCTGDRTKAREVLATRNL